MIVFTEEQSIVRNTARKFAKEVIYPTASKRDKSCEFPYDILRDMGELGFMGMTVPSKYGGAGMDTVSYILALIEIAYSCASTAVIMSVHNSICCNAIVKFGNEKQKNTLLPKMCTGECIGAFALTEPSSGSDASNLKTTAILDNDVWVINGVKQFVTSGKNSGIVLVAAITDNNKNHKSVSVFLVPKNVKGLIVGKVEEKMGIRASDTTQLIFDNCCIPKENILGNIGDGFKITMSSLDSGRIGIAAQSIGVAQACFDEAIYYTKSREQFGKLISEFQGTQWKIADMATNIKAAKLLVLNAALCKDMKSKYTIEASMAKLFASEMVNSVAGEVLQLHGGYGYCSEYSIERHYRDVRVFTIYEGTSEIQRIIIGKNILK